MAFLAAAAGNAQETAKVQYSMLGSILRRCSGRVKATATLVPSLRALGGVRQRSCGLVGMPNVGKSTLFNALSRKQLAEAANYPFCTIDVR